MRWSGAKLRAVRKDARYSQAELAGLIGVSQRTISAWEQEQSEPSYTEAIKMAISLHCDLDELSNQDETA